MAGKNPRHARSAGRHSADQDEPTVVRTTQDHPGSRATRAAASFAPLTDDHPTRARDDWFHKDSDPAHALASDDRRTLTVSLLLTALSTIVPGLGLIGAKQQRLRILGFVVPLACLAALAGFIWWGLTDPAGVAKLASNTTTLSSATPVMAIFGLGWVALILTTHLATRPTGMHFNRRFIGAVAVTALTFAAAAPSAIAARYARDAFLAITSVLPDDVIAGSRPELDQNNPWADIPRLNILLLGADGDAGRVEEVRQFGVRTDTIILASIDTATGDTLLVQIPRNLQRTPFPQDSEMAKAFPDGFSGQPAGDWYINSIWPKVELDYPDLMKGDGNTFRGAEALKLGVQGVTGLEVHYFAMLNIDGLRQLIDAMGGVTVNVNERLPIGGNSNNRRATSWIEAGPKQHLDGYHGLWYARSRWSTDDFDRMRRQSCLIDAIVAQADPATLLTRFESIAAASADLLQTDIPQKDASAIVDLAFKIKDAERARLVFAPGKFGYNYENPQFDQMRAAVKDRIAQMSGQPVESSTSASASASTPEPSETASTAEATPNNTGETSPAASPSASKPADDKQSVGDSCAYHGP